MESEVDALTLGNIQQAAPNIVLNTDFLGDIRDVLALLDFHIGAHLLPEIGYCIHGICSFQGMAERFLIFGIGLVIID